MIKPKFKKWFVGAWLIVLFSGISAFFWYNEWIYSLPTPVPVSYHAVKIGETIDIDDKLIAASDKPLFLHFFNPGCPCSRFNIPHFKSLVKQYGDSVNFAVVVMSKEAGYTRKKIQNKFGLSVPVLFDASIATTCGVYSTPQAVILDQSHMLYYRGNYNKSRYCTDKESNYAQIALDSLLAHHRQTVFNPYALKAYGCTLPICTK